MLNTLLVVISDTVDIGGNRIEIEANVAFINKVVGLTAGNPRNIQPAVKFVPMNNCRGAMVNVF